MSDCHVDGICDLRVWAQLGILRDGQLILDSPTGTAQPVNFHGAAANNPIVGQANVADASHDFKGSSLFSLQPLQHGIEERPVLYPEHPDRTP